MKDTIEGYDGPNDDHTGEKHNRVARAARVLKKIEEWARNSHDTGTSVDSGYYAACSDVTCIIDGEAK